MLEWCKASEETSQVKIDERERERERMDTHSLTCTHTHTERENFRQGQRHRSANKRDRACERARDLLGGGPGLLAQFRICLDLLDALFAPPLFLLFLRFGLLGLFLGLGLLLGFSFHLLVWYERYTYITVCVCAYTHTRALHMHRHASVDLKRSKTEWWGVRTLVCGAVNTITQNMTIKQGARTLCGAVGVLGVIV